MISFTSSNTPRFAAVALFFLQGIFSIVHAEVSESGNRGPAMMPQLRIATVELQELFKQYHRTAVAEKEMSVHRANVQKQNGERLAKCRELDERLGKLRTQIDDPALNESKRQALYKEFQATQQDAIALDRERREFYQRRTQALNEKMVQEMRGLLEEIRKIVEEQAKLENLDYVFDRSGMSSLQVPFLLYAKDSTDITASLLKRINRDAPPGNAVTDTAGKGSVKVEADR